MVTVVNNPGGSGDGSGGIGLVIGLVLMVVIVFVVIVYGLPAIQRSGSPQINVPDEVDININPGNQQGQPQIPGSPNPEGQ